MPGNEDSRSNDQLRKVGELVGHHGSVFGVLLFAKGSNALSFGRDPALRVWDLQTLECRAVLDGHTEEVLDVAIDTVSNRALSGSADHTVRLWDLDNLRGLSVFAGHASAVTACALSPDGRLALSGSESGEIRVWGVNGSQDSAPLPGHSSWISKIAVSSDGRLAVSSSADSTLKAWDLEHLREIAVLEGHTDTVNGVLLLRDGRRALSWSSDRSIRLWDLVAGEEVAALHGHQEAVTKVVALDDDRRAISCSIDSTLRVWDIERQAELAILEGHSGTVRDVVVYDEERRAVSFCSGEDLHVWDLEDHTLLGRYSGQIRTGRFVDGAPHLAVPPGGEVALFAFLGERVEVCSLEGLTRGLSSLYTNAKVVLIGDSGVGKSALRVVLDGGSFQPTESTHGRRITELEARNVMLPSGRMVRGETLLWDLAGQPGYRLIHQLHLREVAVALVVFDIRSETDPFAGVRHWSRALRQAHAIQGSSAPPMKKFLVAARVDRGGVTVSRERIERLLQELGFDGYFETSAKEGVGVAELADAIRDAIDWESLPMVSSTELFQDIKHFLLGERESGRVLVQEAELLRAYRARGEASESEFATCVGRLQARDLLRRLEFGNLVLLQPELIDAYASSLINAARTEPQGLGCIPEDEALAGRFSMPADERLEDPQEEKLLLISMVSDLLGYEIALREPAEDGMQLVFPSQLTRENSALPNPPGKDVVFEFEGPVLNIYTTLAVRLSHSSAFEHEELWKNAVLYRSEVGGGVCGMFLTELGEGRGRITLFYGSEEETPASPQARTLFEAFVHAHLKRQALPDTLVLRRALECSKCRTPVSDIVVQRVLERGRTSMECPVCATLIQLAGPTPSNAGAGDNLLEMARSADAARERGQATAILEGKRVTNDFDVFLCHSPADKPIVREIDALLRERGILAWLDENEVRPGMAWQEELERRTRSIQSVAVFVGASGAGPWQDRELAAFLREFVTRNRPVIPVLLPNAGEEPELPTFIQGLTWLDLREDLHRSLDRLVWGITGVRPDSSAVSDSHVVTEADVQRGGEAVDAAETLRAEAERWRAAGEIEPYGDVMLQLARTLDLEPAVEALTEAFATATGSGVAPRAARLASRKILKELRSLAEQDGNVWTSIEQLTIGVWTHWLAGSPEAVDFEEFARCASGWPAMRLCRLRLVNVKCFGELEIDCRSGLEGAGSDVIVIGNNASGKSTLLQAMALAALGPTRASHAVEGAAAERYLREGTERGAIEAEFELTVTPEASDRERIPVIVGLAIEEGVGDFLPLEDAELRFGQRNHAEHVDLLRRRQGYRWGLVCGYGPFRGLRGDYPARSIREGHAIERVVSLFERKSALLDSKALDELLRKGSVQMLTAERKSVDLSIRDDLLELFQSVIPGLELRADEDKNVHLVESATGIGSITDWSDGCNSTAGLLGHLVLHCLRVSAWGLPPNQVEGIVLIDEVDLHLHPSWQRLILGKLRAVFRGLQIIVSTHSPLVLGGAVDGTQVRVLEREPEGEIVVHADLPLPQGRRADQLLTSDFFDLSTTYDPETERLLEKYARLLDDPDASEEAIADIEGKIDERKQDMKPVAGVEQEAWEAMQSYLRDRLGAMDDESRREFLATLRSHMRGTDHQ